MPRVIVQGPMDLLTIGFIDAEIPKTSLEQESKVITQVAPKNGKFPSIAYDNANNEFTPPPNEAAYNDSENGHPVIEEIRPIEGGLIAVCVLVALFCGMISIAAVLVTGIGILHALAVYFAVGNALVLSAAVIVSHLCRESYDME